MSSETDPLIARVFQIRNKAKAQPTAISRQDSNDTKHACEASGVLNSNDTKHACEAETPPHSNETKHAQGQEGHSTVTRQNTREDDEPRFAGSDIDSMFPLHEYGGRYCQTCGQPMDNHRSHALYCSDACRARDWRTEQKAG